MAQRNFIDRITAYAIDRYDFAKARLKSTAPRYIGHETPVDPVERAKSDGSSRNSDEAIQKVTVMVGWVYSNIILLGSKCAAQGLNVLTRESEKGKFSKDINHPFAEIIRRPNEFMSFSYLIRHLIFSLSIAKKGAFWYLAPDTNTGELTEIWPISSNSIEPIKNSGNYVQKYLYTAKEPLSKKTRQFTIHKDFILWVKYPNPWDYWSSLPPLIAAFMPAKLQKTIEDNQERVYGDSRGIPLSIVSLDKDLQPADFENAKEQIQHDWVNGESSIAVTRGGQIDIASLGFTYEQLETISTQMINRDQIDSIFFGYSYRSDKLTSGEGIKQIDRIIKEDVIHPLLKLIQEAIYSQIIVRHYPGEQIIVQFDDPRTADRALNIQENMIKARWSTMNDMRQSDGEEDMPEWNGIDIGSMPVSLANNSAFLMSLAGLSGGKPQYQQGDPDVGNLADSLAPEAVLNQASGEGAPDANIISGMDTKSVYSSAIGTELKRWKTVARRNVRRNETREFDTEVVPQIVKSTIATMLDNADSEDAVDAVFDIGSVMAKEVVIDAFGEDDVS